ncbi:hypothetical protein C8J56DRAFT_890551 [Mycena floridula]|nr:hypothetical protein C8J56DRAFT_890551 [Mycena floridula]
MTDEISIPPVAEAQKLKQKPKLIAYSGHHYKTQDSVFYTVLVHPERSKDACMPSIPGDSPPELFERSLEFTDPAKYMLPIWHKDGSIPYAALTLANEYRHDPLLHILDYGFNSLPVIYQDHQWSVAPKIIEQWQFLDELLVWIVEALPGAVSYNHQPAPRFHLYLQRRSSSAHGARHAGMRALNALYLCVAEATYSVLTARLIHHIDISDSIYSAFNKSTAELILNSTITNVNVNRIGAFLQACDISHNLAAAIQVFSSAWVPLYICWGTDLSKQFHPLLQCFIPPSNTISIINSHIRPSFKPFIRPSLQELRKRTLLEKLEQKSSTIQWKLDSNDPPVYAPFIVGFSHNQQYHQEAAGVFLGRRLTTSQIAISAADQIMLAVYIRRKTEAELLLPPSLTLNTQTKVFIWHSVRRPEKEWKKYNYSIRIQIPPADIIAVWELYSSKQKHYDPVKDEWDIVDVPQGVADLGPEDVETDPSGIDLTPYSEERAITLAEPEVDLEDGEILEAIPKSKHSLHADFFLAWDITPGLVVVSHELDMLLREWYGLRIPTNPAKHKRKAFKRDAFYDFCKWYFPCPLHNNSVLVDPTLLSVAEVFWNIFQTSPFQPTNKYFDAADWIGTSSIQLVYDTSLHEVDQLIGPGLIHVIYNPSSQLYHLSVPDISFTILLSDALAVCYILRTTGKSQDPLHHALHLLLQGGIPFKLKLDYELDSPSRIEPPAMICRSKAWMEEKKNSADVLAYYTAVRRFLQIPVIACAALMKGGVVWRSTMEANNIDVQDPTTFLQHYRPYTLTEHDLKFVAGIICIEAAHNKAFPSWMPTDKVWTQGALGKVGIWSINAEAWYRRRMHTLHTEEKNGKLLTADLWRSNLRSATHITSTIEAVRAYTSDCLLSQVDHI